MSEVSRLIFSALWPRWLRCAHCRCSSSNRQLPPASASPRSLRRSPSAFACSATNGSRSSCSCSDSALLAVSTGARARCLENRLGRSVDPGLRRRRRRRRRRFQRQARRPKSRYRAGAMRGTQLGGHRYRRTRPADPFADVALADRSCSRSAWRPTGSSACSCSPQHSERGSVTAAAAARVHSRNRRSLSHRYRVPRRPCPRRFACRRGTRIRRDARRIYRARAPIRTTPRREPILLA